MLSVSCNTCIESWGSWETFRKNKKIKAFIDKYNWERIHYPLEIDDWKKIEKNSNLILFKMHQKQIRREAYFELPKRYRMELLYEND